ncbi:glycosyltransferase [Microcella daejeonensis]|uniref:Glycosyltransferase n=1 Tax=Microcella daejeonensis TaxID=2994971 RepID=A0A9E8MLW6_9MICO|nr:glycosyltransferase [Microcella daejeonensis]WAB81869.1 glycosyltransferase [Microcella daejeonensis]
MTGDRLVLSKVVFPGPEEPDTMPLYLDVDEWTELTVERFPDEAFVRRPRAAIPRETQSTPLRISHRNAAPLVTGRRSLTIPRGERVSLATYFNAFPASYWRRWSVVDGVVLEIETAGIGDIVVYRSNARGIVQTVATRHVEGPSTSRFDLAFDNFLDGGWYWFDLVARSEDLHLTEAAWLAPDSYSGRSIGSLSISVTTLNRTAYCLALLQSIASDSDLVESVHEITVVDQGSQHLRDEAGFDEVQADLGDRLRVIEQRNVGGSGGFSRGMLEALQADGPEHVMLLDDDVVVDPEGVRRAHVFAALCRNPTIVGGHMFDMYDKTKLHAFAEGVDRWNFLWGPITPGRHNLTSMNLRQTPWMHRRFDVDYNGWWMSVLPVSVIREIGLSLPVFIKWDDAEYSLRAKSHGVSTVSLPGASVWHVSWVDKDDSRDWQAFYHARNRLVAALLHSPFARGGRLPISNLASDIRHLLTLDYFTVQLRQAAYESVLAGPGALHGELETRLPSIREAAKDFRETRLIREIQEFESFPATDSSSHALSLGARPRGRKAWMRFLVPALRWHWFAQVPESAQGRPDTHVPHGAPWWSVTNRNSMIVSNAEGSGVTWHVRDRARFRSLLVSTVRSNLRIRRQWRALADQYRSSLGEMTSPRRWRETLGLDSGTQAVTPPQSGRER